MFNSTILDVLVGLVFVFLIVSLVASALTEAIASIFTLRSKTLLSGMKAILNDPNGGGLVKDLYNHALINPRDTGDAETANATSNKPAYIHPALFADALMQLSGLKATPGGPADAAALAAKVTALADVKWSPQTKQLLTAVVEKAAGDTAEIRKELATWFDHSMDRVSGAYKRLTQLVTFVLALLIAVGMNIDTIKVAEALWARPLIAKTIDATKYDDATSAFEKLRSLGLPIGWKIIEEKDPTGATHNEYRYADGAPIHVSTLLGWLITALASIFGAPFWYDALQTFVRIKGAGPSPAEKTNDKAAAA